MAFQLIMRALRWPRLISLEDMYVTDMCVSLSFCDDCETCICVDLYEAKMREVTLDCDVF